MKNYLKVFAFIISINGHTKLFPHRQDTVTLRVPLSFGKTKVETFRGSLKASLASSFIKFAFLKQITGYGWLLAFGHVIYYP